MACYDCNGTAEIQFIIKPFINGIWNPYSLYAPALCVMVLILVIMYVFWWLNGTTLKK